MPTLEEWRAFLQGEEVDGLGSWENGDEPRKATKAKTSNGVDPYCDECGEHAMDCECAKPAGLDADAMRTHKAKAKAERPKRTVGGPKYTISADGKDALLNFGKHSGSTVSDLARSGSGRGYLRWMLGESFPDELKDIVRRFTER